MLQKGIEADLPASYVSSMSWYFLCLFGLGAVYRLILGEENGKFILNSTAFADQFYRSC